MTTSVALYRKYRGRTLSEIVGQEHITKPLKNAVAAGHISHAYLFTGPHGVGKTSVARILAHEINQLPYNEQSEHLDIIEIDAASNRRIDEIRDLREKVHIAPSSAKYKVYIIDEVHMLTREAFNALLKTLEEPPQHVVFILATTEAHKLPETIISRTQRHSFKPIQTNDAISHLKHIAKKEKISISDDALALIAEHGRGSFRDNISLFDQIAHSSTSKKIEIEDIRSMLGLASSEIISNLIQAAQEGKLQDILTILDDSYQNGITAPVLAQQLIDALRSQQRLATHASDALLACIDNLLLVGISPKPEVKLETVLIRFALTTSPAAESTIATTPIKKELGIKEPTPKVEKKPAKEAPSTKPEEKTQSLSAPVPSISDSAVKLDEATWASIVTSIKSHNNALHAVIKGAEPHIDDSDCVTLGFKFAFHKKQAEQKKNQGILQEILGQTLGRPVTLQFVVAETAGSHNSAVQQPKTQSIIEAFGGGEVLTNE